MSVTHLSGSKRAEKNGAAIYQKVKKNSSNAVSYLLLIVYAVISIYPFLWMVSSAFKSNQEVLTNKSLIPGEIHFEIIVNTWNQLSFWKYFLNSAIVTTCVVVFVVMIYSLAGYGFAKVPFWGRDFFFAGFLAVMLVPGVTVLIPLVQVLKALGLLSANKDQLIAYTGLILPMINGAGPFAIFLFRNYFSKLPDELRDAAKIDGASEFGIYLRIFLPLAGPAIATVSILNFVSAWNAFIWPSIVINNQNWFTLPLKLKDIDLQQVIQWNVRMAGSLMTTIPLIIVFLVLQRYYIRGITAGATKG
jgi:ABC-type glycerol-3-phosphate transport system permease component